MAIILIVSTSQNVNLTWDNLGFYFVLILALYAVLCVVLGIIALPYALANYALANDNSITSKEAIEESKALMYGNKWNFIKLIILFAIYFVLIGVVVVSIKENAPAVLSELIEAFSSVFILPYFTCAVATFYDDLKDVKVEVVSTKVEEVKTEEPTVEENKTEE